MLCLDKHYYYSWFIFISFTQVCLRDSTWRIHRHKSFRAIWRHVPISVSICFHFAASGEFGWVLIKLRRFSLSFWSCSCFWFISSSKACVDNKSIKSLNTVIYICHDLFWIKSKWLHADSEHKYKTIHLAGDGNSFVPSAAQVVLSWSPFVLMHCSKKLQLFSCPSATSSCRPSPFWPLWSHALCSST